MDSLYTILRSAKIFETDGISLDLCVYQDDVLHAVQGKQTTFHIDGKETSLKVYLPRAKDVQEYIFANVLPKGFAEWMMPDPGTIHAGKATPESLAATKNIMLASHSLLSRALADSGIATIDVANCYETVIPETPLAPRKGGGTHKSDSDSNWSDLAESEALDITGKASSKQHRSSYGGLHGDSEALNETRYVALLDNIIAAGRRSTICLPVRGTFGMGLLQDSLPSTHQNVDFGLRNLSAVEKDIKIGAAGELFVFELLSHLQNDGAPVLPKLSRSEWQSNIRDRVRVHPEYADMPAWLGYETLDNVYQDTSNRSTALFLEKNYFQNQIPQVLSTNSLKYLIEVKNYYPGMRGTILHEQVSVPKSKSFHSLPSFDAAPFPIKYQTPDKVQMRDHVVRKDINAIYVIFRVYHLGRSNMGFKVYLDPEELRDRKQLSFTAEKWSITPDDASLSLGAKDFQPN
ncbi:hypothetical protein BDP55DRAFT_727811 [Colletotrichum godetiae]|uniref:Uncharacterized protein n=1 Tax=Colletotrichum godetiae TaxID=1209918 RepID=A0AAJ0EYR6_9PEZI|nr:uncharacterized protein BDP55DRAFT_727811 [Colletotrichum godetiae]KAK1676480.1 hypothetical protein BDP55DRAFT_727811 [Colletotrichum godetiae]